MLYQLSYAHHIGDIDLARLSGLEPLTYGLEVRCSFLLSYRRVALRFGVGWSGREDSERRFRSSLEHLTSACLVASCDPAGHPSFATHRSAGSRRKRSSAIPSPPTSSGRISPSPPNASKAIARRIRTAIYSHRLTERRYAR